MDKGCKSCGDSPHPTTPHQYSYPYGPNPNPPDVIPECEPSPDPCGKTEVSGRRRIPNSFCDDRFECLPPKGKMRILGADGRCLAEFPDQHGFVVSEGPYQRVTNQPAVQVPYLTDVQKDAHGNVILDQNGEPIVDTPPPFDAIYVTGPHGELFRLQGQPGQQQKMIWVGNRWEVVEDFDPEQNPRILEQNFPVIPISEDCAKEVALVECPIKTVQDGNCVETMAYRLGIRQSPSVPFGSIMPFAGPTSNVPAQWIPADGAPLSTEAYPDLFSAIGYSWGGSGTTFFAPDLRGRTLRGVDAGAGRDPDANDREKSNDGGNDGDRVGSVQGDAMRSHTHEYQKFNFTPPSLNVSYAAFSVGAGHGQTSRVSGVSLNPGSVSEEPDENGEFSLDINLGEAVEIEGSECGELVVSCESRMKNANVNYIIHAGCKRC